MRSKPPCTSRVLWQAPVGLQNLSCVSINSMLFIVLQRLLAVENVARTPSRLVHAEVKRKSKATLRLWSMRYYYYYLFNTPKQQWAKPKQYIHYNAKKLLQITANRPFKALPQSRLYFSPRSYQQITVNIQLTCQRIHVILTSGCKPTHNRIIKHHQPLPTQQLI